MVSDEDTSAGDRDASRREITERKVKADGSVREFTCEALYVTPALAVIRYVIEQPGAFSTPVVVPRGAISDGWFWKRQPYSLYRIREPGGAVIAHRFDAVAGVSIGDDVIEYRDLVLDWWALPDGTVIEEDRQELDDLAAAGVISAATRQKALEAAGTILGRYRHIIDEVAALERKLKIWPADPR